MNTFTNFLTMALATGGVATTEITGDIQNIGNLITGFGAPIFGVVVVIGGIAFMFGESARRWAKSLLLWGAIGFILTMSAPSIVGALQSYFG